MYKLLSLYLIIVSSAYANFTIGYSQYSGSWSTQVSSYQGTFTSYVSSLSSTKGPVAVFTFNIPPNAVNTTPYQNGLGAVLFTNNTQVPQILYATNYTLNQFQTQTLSSQTAICYVETNNNFQRLLTSFMDVSSGLFTNSPTQVFPFQNNLFTKITLGQAANNTCVIAALSSNTANTVNFLYTKAGSLKGFNQTPKTLTSPFSNPFLLTQTSNANVSTIAFSQNNYGQISTSYVLENASTISNPITLTDANETGCQFINFNTAGNVLFIADNTLQGTTRLGASFVQSSGALSPINFILANYSYNTSIPLTFTTDANQNQYLIFNGAATSYNNNALQIGVYNTGSKKWQSFLTGPSLFISSTNACQATPFNQGIMLTELSNGLYFTLGTFTNTAGQTVVGSTPTFITGYNISSCILNNTNFTFSTITTLNQTFNNGSGSITPFYTPPNYTSCVDNAGNVVFAFSGYTNYNNLIFSNVYINTSGTFTGQNLMNGVYGSPTQGSNYPSITFYGTTTAPSAISSPTLISQGSNIACIWSQNVGGTYTIYGAVYLPLKLTFSTPVQLATGFTSMPSISTVPGFLGFVFAGNN